MLDSRRSLPAARALLLAAAALFVFLSPAWTQPPSTLRADLERQFQVEPSSGGVTLKFRAAQPGVDNIAVAGAEIRVNGAKVPEGVLVQWIGAAAAPVLQLSKLPAAEQRKLFGFDARDLVSLPPTAAPSAPIPPPPPSPPSGAAETPEASTPAEPEETPAPEAPTRLRRVGDQFTIFDDLEIGPDETASAATAVFGDVTVLGEVRRDALAVFGRVRVEGTVGGEVTSVYGGVELGPHARVGNGVTAVGGRVERAAGSEVQGSQTEVPLGAMGRHGEAPGLAWLVGLGPFLGSGGHLWALFWRLFKLCLAAILLSAIWLAVPRAVSRVQANLEREWWKAGLVGLLVWILFLPALGVVILALLITIVGCLLIVPLLIVVPFALAAALLLGYAGVAKELGEWLKERFGLRIPSGFGTLVAGLAVIEATTLLGALLLVSSGCMRLPGWMFLGLGSMIRFVALTLGLGSVVLTRFGRRGPLKGEGPPNGGDRWGIPVVPEPPVPAPPQPAWSQPEPGPTFAMPPLEPEPPEPPEPEPDSPSEPPAEDESEEKTRPG
ncbi:MAG TPA: hypothetical protein PK413_11675 [Thermoanaerobaculia bacterium]|nr:hypothetical protein [Thermoanaerobaculia bacterium]